MVVAPEPIHKNPKTIFEWFLNVYCWFDAVNSGEAESIGPERQKMCVSAWLRFRRYTPDILQTKDKSKVLNWIPSDWEAVSAKPPTQSSLDELYNIDIGSTPPRPAPPPPAEPTINEAEGADELLSEDTDQSERQGGVEDLPKTLSWDVECKDDEPVKDVMHAKKYFDSYIEKELDLDYMKWTPAEVRDFILELSRKRHMKEERIQVIANASFQSNIDGMLLKAGGADLLMERAVGYCKWDKSILKSDANKIFTALKEKRLKAQASYWERNRHIQVLFGSSMLKDPLEAALMPRPFGDIRYVSLCTRSGGERSCAIDTVNANVSKSIANDKQQFKVVSVVTPDDDMLVNHNFIYYNDRKMKCWVLLVSVDFISHGEEAPSGHWHLNRAPLGELVPHWGPSSTFHGDPLMCPVWWHLIPGGMRYHTIPERAPLYSWVTNKLK